ncbi:uncharacterized protein [Procambarus clarkii]|uniref:uncharacterized protein n=1 Tax=Procambarus clarkii TaxID=6728 RepID=UPI00374433A0
MIPQEMRHKYLEEIYKDAGDELDQIYTDGSSNPVNGRAGAAYTNLLTPKEEFVEKVFHNIEINYKNQDWLSERALLAVKNKDVYELNNIFQSNIQSEAVTYKSVDTVEEADEAVRYPTELLNSLDLPWIPTHNNRSIEIQLANYYVAKYQPAKTLQGHAPCSKKIFNNVAEATMFTGPFNGEDVLIPRIPIIPKDMSFQLKRL